MPFKRGPYYRIQILDLPGYGPFPETATYTASKATARSMERLVRQIAERALDDPSWRSLLDALRAGRRGERPRLRLPELLASHSAGELDALRRLLRDPLLSEAIAQYEETAPGYDTTNGLRILALMAERELGSPVRFSQIRSGKVLTLLTARAEREGGRPSPEHPQGRPMKRNSARRTILLSASKLIRFHLGGAERDRVFADVSAAHERDVRDVWLAPNEIQRLLDACADFFRPFVLAALATGADRSPLLRLRVRDVVLDSPTGPYAYLRDTKTTSRPRSVALAPPLAEALRPLVEGKHPDDAVFDGPPEGVVDRRRVPRAYRREGLETGPLTEHQVRYFFGAARDAAGLPHVRFKDLRRTWAVTADSAGLSLGEMKAGLGHGLEETTVRYTNRQVTLDAEAAERVARHMGLLAAEAPARAA